MTHRRTTRPAPVLAVLFAGAFVMGCAEMLVVGLPNTSRAAESHVLLTSHR